ncbi:MAG: alpha-galactosidase [Armatimonadetes bacterium]|nr:alpha-galactosidase [Armatimonadota bacterium]
MKWADREAAIRFVEQHFNAGRALPLTMKVDGVETRVAASADRCQLCGTVIGWVGDVQAHTRLVIWDRFAAVELTGFLENVGDCISQRLSDIMTADVELGPLVGELTVHHAHGSACEATDFLPLETKLDPDGVLELAPVGGRSSNGTLPFFNLAWEGGGVVVAIGWSGQWHAWIEHVGDKVRLRVGQEHTNLRLLPRERIRTPKVLLVFYRGEEYQCGNNVLRQCLLAHYCPRHDGQLFLPPVTHNTWFVYNEGNETTEENQLRVIERLARLKLRTEVFWLDAGWFEGGWPHGVGSWVPRADNFPRGLRPLGDAAHQNGMKFCVWFEPERVAPDSRIARDQPSFVLQGPVNWTGVHDGLFNLGNPQAREYLTSILSHIIAESGIDIYRNDFNIDPLEFWRAADEPEREGITEIRYVEGLYEMWAELMRRHPGLMIDNCASGGRRIDLETCSLSIPLWRSDTQCSQKPQPVWDQVQTSGLTRYVPFHSAGVWAYDQYNFWSVATAGVNHCLNITAPDFDATQLRQRVDELFRWRKYWLGNFWALTPVTLSDEDWCAWQLHLPESGDGIIFAFRRVKAPEVIELRPREIDEHANYEVTDEEIRESMVVPGADFAHVQARVKEAPGVAIMTYRRA